MKGRAVEVKNLSTEKKEARGDSGHICNECKEGNRVSRTTRKRLTRDWKILEVTTRGEEEGE